MIDNTKEYILCAAYLNKEDYVTPRIEEINNEMKENKVKHTLQDIRDVYHQPHRQVFDMSIGWRHCDILYKYGDVIQKKTIGGFLTSKGRYVDRKEAAKIALACGQITNPDIDVLYSEDLY